MSNTHIAYMRTPLRRTHTYSSIRQSLINWMEKARHIDFPMTWTHGFKIMVQTVCVCVCTQLACEYICVLVYVCTVVCTVFVCYLEQPPHLSMFGLLESRPVWCSVCYVHKINPPPNAHTNTHTHEFQEWCHPASLSYKADHSTLRAEVVGRSSQWGILMRFHDVCFRTGSLLSLTGKEVR